MLLTGISAALMAAFGDDDRMKDVPIEERLNYYVIFPKAGSDAQINIPKPFEFGAIFSTLPEFIFEAIRRKEGGDLARAVAMTFLNTFGFDPRPQAVKPIWDVVANYDSFRSDPFTGKRVPIEGRQVEGLSPVKRSGPLTSDLVRMVG